MRRVKVRYFIEEITIDSPSGPVVMRSKAPSLCGWDGPWSQASSQFGSSFADVRLDCDDATLAAILAQPEAIELDLVTGQPMP